MKNQHIQKLCMVELASGLENLHKRRHLNGQDDQVIFRDEQCYEDDYADSIEMMLETMAYETATEAEELETINIEGVREDYISERDLLRRDYVL